MTKATLMMQPMTPEQIMQAAPQVFAPAPKPGLSARYTFLPTSRIVEDMQRMGWLVCQAKGSRSRNVAVQEFGNHVVRFYHPDIFIRDQNGNIEAYVNFLVFNNHNGLGRYKIKIGLFRLVCSNGLVVEDKDLGSFDVRHTGYSFEQLQETMNGIIERLPSMVGTINAYNSVQLTLEQQLDFAAKALQLRTASGQVPTQEELTEFLTPRRPEDEGNSLWIVLNRVQESIIDGGYYLTNKKGKPRRAKSIRNIQKDIQLNQQIWELATEYVTV